MQRILNSRLRRPVAALVAFLVVALVPVVVRAPDADASVIDWAARNVPTWAFDAADSIYNACDGAWNGIKEMPASWLGAGTGGLAFVGNPAAYAAGGSGGVSAALTGTGGAAAGGGVAAVAGTVGLGALTFAGVGCASVKLHAAAFGYVPASDAVPKGGPIVVVTPSASQLCSLMPVGQVPAGVQDGDWCVRFPVPPGATKVQLWAKGTFGSGYQRGPGPVNIRTTSGSLSTASQAIGANPVTVVVPCATPAASCGFTPAGWLYPNMSWGSSADYYGTVFELSGVGVDVGFATAGVLTDRGWLRRLRVSVSCKRPADGVTTTVDAFSGEWFDAIEKGAEWPAAGKCPVGYAPTNVTATRQWLQGGATSAASWSDSETVMNTPTVSAAVAGNPTSLQCFVVGTTVCPIWESDPGNPTNNQRRLGGVAGLVMPSGEVTVGAGPLAGLIASAPWTAEAPTPTTTPTPTTAVSPSTTTTSTSSAPTTTLPPPPPVDPPVPPEPPPVPPGGGSAWATCMAERTSGAFDDVNINPVTWVRAIVLWMVAPIICAVWWLFVPPGGWGVLVADLRDLWANAPALSPIRAFTDSLTVDTSRCFPVDLPDVAGIDVPTIDVALCGNPVVTMVWGVAVALGVLAIAREAIRTVSRLAAFDSVTGGFNSDSQYYMR